MTVTTGMLTARMAEFVVGAAPPPGARDRAAVAVCDTFGVAAAAARVLKLPAAATVHAIGIAASLACGLKENMGTMVKPLHAGTAARNGVMAARLAQQRFTASGQAIDGVG